MDPLVQVEKRADGTAVFRGTSVPVSALLAEFGAGRGIEDFAARHPGVREGDPETVLRAGMRLLMAKARPRRFAPRDPPWPSGSPADGLRADHETIFRLGPDQLLTQDEGLRGSSPVLAWRRWPAAFEAMEWFCDCRSGAAEWLHSRQFEGAVCYHVVAFLEASINAALESMRIPTKRYRESYEDDLWPDPTPRGGWAPDPDDLTEKPVAAPLAPQRDVLFRSTKVPLCTLASYLATGGTLREFLGDHPEVDPAEARALTRDGFEAMAALAGPRESVPRVADIPRETPSARLRAQLETAFRREPSQLLTRDPDVCAGAAVFAWTEVRAEALLEAVTDSEGSGNAFVNDRPWGTVTVYEVSAVLQHGIALAINTRTGVNVHAVN